MGMKRIKGEVRLTKEDVQNAFSILLGLLFPHCSLVSDSRCYSDIDICYLKICDKFRKHPKG